MPKSATKPSARKNPRLTTLTKVVTRPDEYDIPAGNGKKIKRRFTEDDLKRIAENINAQVEAGHKVPAPFKHYITDKVNKSKKLFVDETLLDGSPSDKFIFDSSLNAGYWKNARFVDDCSTVNPEFEQGPGLVVDIDAPGDPNDPKTPAGMLGTSVQDTSIALLPSYRDGKSREWKDFVAHIAVPVHPIETGQDNFALAMSDDEYPLILSMTDDAPTPTRDPSGSSAPSTRVPPSSESGDQEADAQFTDCVNLLRSACQVDLPPDTTPDNLVQVLCIALRQKVADQKANQAQNSITTQPPGSQARPAPVAMGETDPPSEPQTMSEENKVVTALLNREIKNKKAELHTRVRKLVNQGAFDQKYVDANFIPEIDALTMSAEDLDDKNEFPTPFIERRIRDAEETAKRLGTLTMSASDEGEDYGSMPDGAVTHQPPNPGVAPDVEEARADEILDRTFPALA